MPRFGEVELSGDDPNESNDWVRGATLKAMKRIMEHADKVGLSNTEEFTFRAAFMAAAYDLLPGVVFQTEWKKFDLLVSTAQAATIIEFKYYLLRRTAALDGTPLKHKGGAGPKNESEFWRCIDKLRHQVPSGISRRCLVLVYQRDYPRSSSSTFHRSYSNLSSATNLPRVMSVSVGPLEARIIDLDPTAIRSDSTVTGPSTP